MAQLINLKLVIELTQSQASDSVSDSDQGVTHPWPGDPVSLDISTPPTCLDPVWIATNADGTVLKSFPVDTSAADILAEGWAHLYQGTQICDSAGNANIYSNQYNHVLLAIAACCNNNFQTQVLALKLSQFPLVPGQTYPCGSEAKFTWLVVYGKNEDRPNLSARFDITLTSQDGLTVLSGPFSSFVIPPTGQITKSWPNDFIGMTIDGVNLVANDVEPMPGERRVMDFDNGTIEVKTVLLDESFEILLEEANTWALPGTQCGANCVDPYPDPLTLPDATDGVAYNATTQLDGDGPFALEIVQKPAWLTATLNPITGLITWGGTPPTFGNDQVVEFKAENCGEAITEATPSSGEILLDVKQVMTFIARTSPGNQPWYKVRWISWLNLYVAISQQDGSGTQVATSPDGETWTLRNTPGNINWNCITDNGVDKIVVMGTGQVGAIMTSPDAINWTAHDAPEVVQSRGVAWSASQGIYVSVGSLGTNRILKSNDGETWTTVTAPVLNQWYGLLWSDALSLFVATAINGSGNQVMTSEDGDTWTIQTTDATSRSWFYVNEGNGLLIATAASGAFGVRVMTSTDAVTWTLRQVQNVNNTFTGSAYGNGAHVIVGNANSGQPYERSADGISWTLVAGPVAPYTGITFGNNRFVVVGTNVFATADWT
jgi:hypothetical protein